MDISREEVIWARLDPTVGFEIQKIRPVRGAFNQSA
jgi:hypothetical protein